MKVKESISSSLMVTTREYLAHGRPSRYNVDEQKQGRPERAQRTTREMGDFYLGLHCTDVYNKLDNDNESPLYRSRCTGRAGPLFRSISTATETIPYVGKIW